MARRTALKEMPKGGAGALKRLSPGVYRNASGQLVGPQGQRLPGRPAPRPNPQERLRQGNPVFAGGTPNFDERTGRYTDPRQGALRGNLDVERAAQERAEAIRRGGMVTYDYMPERDRRVDEILGRQPQEQRTPQMGPPLTWNDQQPMAPYQRPSFMGPMELPQGQNPYAYQKPQAPISPEMMRSMPWWKG